MAATTPIPRRRDTNDLKHPKIQKEQGSAIDHAVRLIHAVCSLAGSATWIDDIRANLRADKWRRIVALERLCNVGWDGSGEVNMNA
jgi:hypothetical protein